MIRATDEASNVGNAVSINWIVDSNSTADLLQALWDTITDLQMQIDNIQLIPGPPGPPGVDILGTLACTTNQIAKYDGSQWIYSTKGTMTTVDCNNLVPDVNLAGCNLVGLRLTGIDLSNADLTNIDFKFSDLSGADFTNTDLTGVDFTGCTGIPFGTPAVGVLPTCS